MPDLRPFRALRHDPSRVDVGALVAPLALLPSHLASVDVDDERALLERDPRNVVRFLATDHEAGDSPDAAHRRARLHLGEQRRSGVLVVDEVPAVYALRRDDGALGVLVAYAIDALPQGEPDAQREHRLQALDVAVEPALLAIHKDAPRVRRVLESELDREPDISVTVHNGTHELWAIDDDTAVARLSALLPRSAVGLAGDARVIGAHRALTHGLSSDEPWARAHVLAFVVEDPAAWTHVPMGLVMLPLVGVLS